MRLLALSCEGLTSLALWFDGRRCRVKCSETADSVAFGKRSPATRALGNTSMEWPELFVWEVTNALEVLMRDPSTGLRPRCFSLCRQRHERQTNVQVCSSTPSLPTSSLGKLTPHVLTIVLHNRYVSLHDNWIVTIDPTSGYVRSSPCFTVSVPADVHLAPLHLGRAQSSRWLEHEAGRARQTASLPGCSLATRDRRH